MTDINFAVLGTGGIGRRALEISQYKDGIAPVAACDRNGIAVDCEGLDVKELLNATEGNIAGDGSGESEELGKAANNSGSKIGMKTGVKQTGESAGIVASAQGKSTETPIDDIIVNSDMFDAVLIALPNLEHDFIPRISDRFAEAEYSGVLVDVLKRSRVIEMLDERENAFKKAGITFICGAGATPGFLTGAAAIAAQSFVKVEEVEIWWGVGLKSGYTDNRGTVREDIAHLDGDDIKTARGLSTEEIEEIIDEHDGVLEFHDMEHADDILLERSGICDADNVSVGGVLDVRSDEKPTTTTVRVTGTTFDGKKATNMFQFDDNTSMAANLTSSHP